jgi:hypothetical protein
MDACGPPDLSRNVDVDRFVLKNTLLDIWAS